MEKGEKIMAELTLTKDNFEKEVLNANGPVLVDFWASWCGPCKMMGPVVSQIADEMEGKLKVGKVNVDDEQELAMKYNVMSIPTFIMFENGQVKNMSVGVQGKDRLIRMM